MMYKKNKDNIVIFSLEHENKKENLLGQNFAISLLEIITKLEKESELKGVIILFTNIICLVYARPPGGQTSHRRLDKLPSVRQATVGSSYRLASI